MNGKLIRNGKSKCLQNKYTVLPNCHDGVPIQELGTSLGYGFGFWSVYCYCLDPQISILKYLK